MPPQQAKPGPLPVMPFGPPPFVEARQILFETYHQLTLTYYLNQTEQIMQESQTDILTNDLIQENAIPRKKMLPLWIKIFMWLFLITGAFVPIVLISGLMGYNAQLALYGLETNEAFSYIGIILTTIYIIKGITAFSLLKEKDWAIKIGIIDATIGIIICILIMLYPFINPQFKFSLRLELVALIPYLIKLLKIKTQWEAYVKI